MYSSKAPHRMRHSWYENQVFSVRGWSEEVHEAKMSLKVLRAEGRAPL